MVEFFPFVFFATLGFECEKDGAFNQLFLKAEYAGLPLFFCYIFPQWEFMFNIF